VPGIADRRRRGRRGIGRGTAEGRVAVLDELRPSAEAFRLARNYQMDPRLVEVVLRESDRIVGGIPGFLLCMKNGTLLRTPELMPPTHRPALSPLLPVDPDASAARIRAGIAERSGADVGVIIADSRTHAMRLGCSGGRHRMFGHPLGGSMSAENQISLAGNSRSPNGQWLTASHQPPNW